MRTILLSLILTLPAAAVAQETPSKAASAADRFALDLPTDDAVTTPPPADPAPPPPVAKAPAGTFSPGTLSPGTLSPGTFSLDTPIADLVADPRAKAVLDRNLPGLSKDENLPKFRALSLRKFAPLTGGQLTPALLQQTALDLATLSAGGAPSRPAAKKVPVGR